MKYASLLAALAMVALAPAQSDRKLTKADVDRLMSSLSNWGRWGKEDQVGAVNLITPAKRKAAAALVRDGIAVSLSRNADTVDSADNRSPFAHKMTPPAANASSGFALDNYSVSYHGFAHTHMDSLCHMFYDGKMYNGFSKQETTARGAGKLAVTNYKTGIFTRGILMDIPRLKQLPWLEPGQAIYPEDLDAWLRRAGLVIEAGDVIFIRTGRWARRASKGPWDVGSSSAGLHASCARWLRRHDIAILGSDAASDVMPSGVEGVRQPIHQLVLVAMGMPIFDNCDLEAVAETASRLQRWEFLITAAPLAVEGGTGSPFNPVAVF